MKKLIACGIFLILIGCGVNVSPEPAPKYAFEELQPIENFCYDGYWLVRMPGQHAGIYKLNSLGGPVPCPLYGTTH